MDYGHHAITKASKLYKEKRTFGLHKNKNYKLAYGNVFNMVFAESELFSIHTKLITVTVLVTVINRL